MFRNIVMLILFCIGFDFSAFPQKNETAKIDNVKQIDVADINSFYIGNKMPLQPMHFIKLPIGSIQPKGWLARYLQLQRDGITGHLGEISAWLSKKDNAWLNPDGKGKWGWEEVPYWLKGYGNLGYILKDQKIISETN
ncbi:MAG: hypothetical protein QM610_09115 [Chitinophagaceae bacterium]